MFEPTTTALCALLVLTIASVMYAIRLKVMVSTPAMPEPRYDSFRLQQEVLQTLTDRMEEGERTGSYVNRHFYTAMKAELKKCSSPIDFDVARMEKDLRASRKKRYEGILRTVSVNQSTPK